MGFHTFEIKIVYERIRHIHFKMNVKSDSSISPTSQVSSITTTSAMTTPTSPVASSSLLQASSSSWEWASTTGCWQKRRKMRREKRGRSPRRSEPLCWRLPLRPNQTGRMPSQLLSCWMKLPGWTRTRCRKQKTESRRRHTHVALVER